MADQPEIYCKRGCDVRRYEKVKALRKTVRSLSIHDDDGDKNVANLHI